VDRPIDTIPQAQLQIFADNTMRSKTKQNKTKTMIRK